MPPRPDFAALGRAVEAGALVVCWCRAGPDIGAVRVAVRALAAEARSAIDPGRRLFWSRTACPGLGAVAMSASGPIGVDVETPLGLAPDPQMIEIVATAQERTDSLRDARNFAALWARKEAVSKAFGVGLALPPNLLHVGHADARWRRVDSPWGGQARVRTIETPDLCLAAVATRGPAARVTTFRAGCSRGWIGELAASTA